ncbi:hypothetical protein RISK_006029 [Rhodopirellula islandica]|uniref:Uncharacterized protein n=1 Tax=Rhodopirellula islandica TaxID=595434 RepID=A0A0J1B4S4_RHOIS|nr:hypothetical protein RISK_006029 [Rhodopirellula islandica]
MQPSPCQNIRIMLLDDSASHANIGGQMFYSHFMLNLRTQVRSTEANDRSQSRTVVPNCSVEQPSTAKPCCNEVPVKGFASCCSTTEASHANIGGQMFYSHFMLNLRTQCRKVPSSYASWQDGLGRTMRTVWAFALAC